MSVIARSENDDLSGGQTGAIFLRFLKYYPSLLSIREYDDCRDIHVSPHSGHYRDNDSQFNFGAQVLIIDFNLDLITKRLS